MSCLLIFFSSPARVKQTSKHCTHTSQPQQLLMIWRRNEKRSIKKKLHEAFQASWWYLVLKETPQRVDLPREFYFLRSRPFWYLKNQESNLLHQAIIDLTFKLQLSGCKSCVFDPHFEVNFTKAFDRVDCYIKDQKAADFIFAVFGWNESTALLIFKIVVTWSGECAVKAFKINVKDNSKEIWVKVSVM